LISDEDLEVAALRNENSSLLHQRDSAMAELDRIRAEQLIRFQCDMPPMVYEPLTEAMKEVKAVCSDTMTTSRAVVKELEERVQLIVALHEASNRGGENIPDSSKPAASQMSDFSVALKGLYNTAWALSAAHPNQCDLRGVLTKRLERYEAALFHAEQSVMRWEAEVLDRASGTSSVMKRAGMELIQRYLRGYEARNPEEQLRQLQWRTESLRADLVQCALGDPRIESLRAALSETHEIESVVRRETNEEQMHHITMMQHIHEIESLCQGPKPRGLE
jgi:hypothetical protein